MKFEVDRYLNPEAVLDPDCNIESVDIDSQKIYFPPFDFKVDGRGVWFWGNIPRC